MRKLLDIFYTIYFNFRYLPIAQAIHLPVYVTTNLRDVKIRRGQLVIDAPVRYKQVLIGGGQKSWDTGIQVWTSHSKRRKDNFPG